GMYYASQPQGNTMITVADNALSGNWARNGGGVLCIACSPVLVRNLISDNASDQGGGVMCWGASSPTIDTTVIAFNDSGGGLVVSDDPANPAEADVKHCNVYGNTGGNYLNWPDQTGTNGNVSENPLLAGWRPRAV
ncbi:MAG: right-handed parallel beta-helix repeat-containing protein, partial [Armatimonadota bacterium]